MDAWLDRLRREIEETTGAVRCGLEPRAAGTLEQRPDSGTFGAQLRRHGKDAGVEPGCGRSATGRGAAKISERLKQFLVVRLGIFPSGRKAPAIVTPQRRRRPGCAGADTERAGAHEGCYGGGRGAVGERGTDWDAFVLGPMNPAQWRKFHYLHGHHHVRQMRERLGEKAGR